MKIQGERCCAVFKEWFVVKTRKNPKGIPAGIFKVFFAVLAINRP